MFYHLIVLALILNLPSTAFAVKRDIVAPFNVAISAGNISDVTSFSSIGERVAVAVTATGDDIWRGTATTMPIPDQTNGEQMTLVSTSASDAAAGTGVRTVYIHYLDANWAEQVETVTLNGVTGVDTVATNIKFINGIHTNTAGSGLVAAGDITIYKKGAASTVYDMIATGGNGSLTGNKMVPAGKTFYLMSWQASSTAGKPIFVRLRSTDHHGHLYDGGSPIFIFKDSATVQDSTYVRKFEVPVRIPAKSIIKATAWATQAGGNVSISWEGILIAE